MQIIDYKDDYAMSDTPPVLDDNFLKVSATSNPQKVAQAIAHTIYDKHRATVRAVGAGAINQAVKAVAIARGYVAQRGMDLICRPGFANIPGRVETGETTISAIVLTLSVV